MGEKNLDQARAFTAAVAAKQGWTLNPDSAFTESLAEGLLVNWNRYGYFLCPCRDSEGTREADREVICPCTYAKPDIEEYGHCFCALYMRTDFAASGEPFKGIPDRRFTK